MKHYKVKIGYGPMEFLSIDETELSKALRAQTKGSVAIFKTGSVSGNHIISITPDWNKELGLNPDYVLKGDDLAQIPTARKAEYVELMEDVIYDKVLTSPSGMRLYTKEPTSIGQLLENK